jgi:amino acid adenylation domain-containing protein
VRAVVTSAALAGAFAGAFAGAGIPRVVVAPGRAPEGPPPASAGAPAPPAEAAAYLIYTSGSSGRPKGVVVPHRALAAFVDAARREYGIGPSDRVLQLASVSFDTSAEEIFPTLTAGATLVLRDEEMLASAAAFLDACARHRLTVIDFPTAYWHELVAGMESGDLGDLVMGPPVSLVILGGERVIPERLAAFAGRLAPGVRLLNTYGPTETTVAATRFDLLAGGEEVVRRAREGIDPPIGRPLADATAHVLDPWLRLLPGGMPGELALGGHGLARGYLARPAATAERFAPDPFAAERPGARLYRTGDRARRRPDGEIDFLGRIDRQVKIRGFRVELGEIEAALRRHTAVAEAVVTVRDDEPGRPRLVAYTVGRNGATPDGEALQDFLDGVLPDFMVPRTFVALDRLPLTPTGKVDRRALPAPGEAGSGPGEVRPFTPPATPAEESLAAIFAEVLGLDRVGADEDFFRLGGHSLLLPQVLHRVRQAFDVEVPLRALYDEPTVVGLALAIEERILEEIEAGLEPGLGDAEPGMDVGTSTGGGGAR